MIAKPDNDESPFTLEERINTLEEHIDVLYKEMTEQKEQQVKQLGMIRESRDYLLDLYKKLNEFADKLFK